MIFRQFFICQSADRSLLNKRGALRPNSCFHVKRWLTAVVCLISCLLFAGSAQAEDYNKAFLVNFDFSNQVLIDSSFTKANLRGSNLSGANLEGVSFFGANLEDANLEGADLRNATLDAARLVNANLTNAVLEGAFAFNAQFNGATIEGADFTDVLFRQDVQTLLCKRAAGVNPTTGRETRETLECF